MAALPGPGVYFRCLMIGYLEGSTRNAHRLAGGRFFVVAQLLGIPWIRARPTIDALAHAAADRPGDPPTVFTWALKVLATAG